MECEACQISTRLKDSVILTESHCYGLMENLNIFSEIYSFIPQDAIVSRIFKCFA